MQSSVRGRRERQREVSKRGPDGSGRVGLGHLFERNTIAALSFSIASAAAAQRVQRRGEGLSREGRGRQRRPAAPLAPR